MRSVLAKFSFLVVFVFCLQACGTLGDLLQKDSQTDDEYHNWTAKKFYDRAQKAMTAKNYQKAIKLFENLEARYPFGSYAAQTQLDVAYAYFKNDNPEAAIAAAERFIKINPTNPNVDYAYYLKGLVNFNRNIGFLERYLPTDSSQRDPQHFKVAYDNFAELVQRFPNSQYTPDAKQRMVALRNNLAMHEVHVARFYLKRKAYVAAVNRANTVLKDYQGTIAVPYSLKVLQRAYTKLNLKNLAGDVDRIYQLNFPNGPPKTDINKTFFEKVWDFTALDE